jgi:hypothetical protein
MHVVEEGPAKGLGVHECRSFASLPSTSLRAGRMTTTLRVRAI